MTAQTPDYGPDIEIRRSNRRRKTLQARVEGRRTVIMVPAGMDPEDEKRQVAQMVEQLHNRITTSLDNTALEKKARRLARVVLEGRPQFDSIRWVKNMSRRWASVSLEKGNVRIRVSHRLAEVPEYVLDDVIVHELVHTFIEDGHSDEFWEWAAKAPHHERARGYLEAYQRWGVRS